MLATTGCADFSIPFLGSGSRPEAYRRVAFAPLTNGDIDAVLKAEAEAVYDVPALRRDLRGVQASAALIMIGRGERREPPLMGGWREGKAFAAGRLAVVPYLVYYLAHRDERRLRTDPLAEPRVRAALRSPDAARVGLVLDTLTGTESGPPLEAREFEVFRAARFEINAWLGEVGVHPPVRVGHKDVETIASPRDRQLAGPTYAEGNEVSAGAIARLLFVASQGGLPRADVAASLFEELRVARGTARAGGAGGAGGAIAAALPPDAIVWGATSDGPRHYHDAAVVEWPGRGRFILVILTNDATKGEVLARELATRIVAAIRSGQLPMPRELGPAGR